MSIYGCTVIRLGFQSLYFGLQLRGTLCLLKKLVFERQSNQSNLVLPKFHGI